MLNVWILKDGEPLPHLDADARLMRAFNMGSYLSQHGCNVTWWSSNWSHYKKEKYTNSDHVETVNNNFFVKIIDCCGYKKNISISRMRHYSELANKFLLQSKDLEKPDLIISCLPSIELSYAATKYSEEVGCPILIDFRDMWPDIFTEIFPKFIRPLVRIAAHNQFSMMKELCKKATGFIGISQPYLQWAANYASRSVGNNDFVGHGLELF